MPTPSQQTAIDWARRFVDNGVGRVFFNINPANFLNDLQDRIEHPEKINQQKAAVCGPATFLYGMALKGPLRYSMFACNLFMFGSARLGKLKIVASDDVRGAAPLHLMSAADWVTLASLRLDRNWFFKDPSNLKSCLSGVTLPQSLAKWFRKAGYRTSNSTNLLATKSWTNWQRACNRFTNGEIVCLFINANMLKEHPSTISTTPNHWVGLKLVRTVRNPVDVKVFTYGISQQLYFATAREHLFKRHYYGYVSASI